MTAYNRQEVQEKAKILFKDQIKNTGLAIFENNNGDVRALLVKQRDDNIIIQNSINRVGDKNVINNIIISMDDFPNAIEGMTFKGMLGGRISDISKKINKKYKTELQDLDLRMMNSNSISKFLLNKGVQETIEKQVVSKKQKM